MIPRERIRDLSIACRLACHTGGAISGKPLHDIAEVLETPTWFSANELRLAADAMDILGTATADGWTLRASLDAFWKTGPLIKNAGSFAAYLHELPNGGVQ